MHMGIRTGNFENKVITAEKLTKCI